MPHVEPHISSEEVLPHLGVNARDIVPRQHSAVVIDDHVGVREEGSRGQVPSGRTTVVDGEITDCAYCVHFP